MAADAKSKLLETGAHLFRTQGYNNTGLGEILAKAGVPKGSFYYYFKSKEDFGLQVVGVFNEVMKEGFFSRFLTEEMPDDTSPLDHLRNFFAHFRESFLAEETKCGCPIGNISQELAALHPSFRKKLQIVLSTVVEPLCLCLEKAVAKGELPEGTQCRELAQYLFTSWQGALIFMKVTDNGEPLEFFEKYTFDNLLPGMNRQRETINTGG